MIQLNTDDNKLNTPIISNNESESAGTWFWNKIANKTDSDSGKESCNDVDKRDLENKQLKMEQAVSLKSSKVELK